MIGSSTADALAMPKSYLSEVDTATELPYPLIYQPLNRQTKETDMRIAILGAGNVGGGLAAAAVRAGHDVVLSASKPESAQTSAEATGATAAASNADAVRGADVVVL